MSLITFFSQLGIWTLGMFAVTAFMFVIYVILAWLFV